MNMQISLRLHSTTPSLSAPLSLAYMDSSSKNNIKNIKVAGKVCITCIQISSASFPMYWLTAQSACSGKSGVNMMLL